jgi:predicted phosphate transport protein (TIGR00153 family)
MPFLPKEKSFFDDFEEQGRRTAEGCRVFLALSQDLSRSAEQAREIKALEEQCDSITHRVVEKLHKTFITPLDRNDIHRLITKMDDVMDYVEAVAERILLYEISSASDQMRALARNLFSSAERVLEAVTGLRDLKNPRVALDKCVEINRLENEADALLRDGLARLFRQEKDPIAIIKWKELYELLESATDRCEDVANIIEGVVLENS